MVELGALHTELLTREHITTLQSFTCGDDDLDEFVRQDAIALQIEHLVVVTYLAFLECESGDELVGFISLAMDGLTATDDEKPGNLRFRSFPALKIARLGVSLLARKRLRGIGTALVHTACIKGLELANVVGVRFLTVDAYKDAEGFYARLGFVPNLAKTYKKQRNRSMRLDLLSEELPGSALFADDLTVAEP